MVAVTSASRYVLSAHIRGLILRIGRGSSKLDGFAVTEQLRHPTTNFGNSNSTNVKTTLDVWVRSKGWDKEFFIQTKA